eukprot:s1626_g1.t1
MRPEKAVSRKGQLNQHGKNQGPASEVQSSRQCCRQGFCLALAEVLQAFPHELATVLKLVDQTSELQSGLKATEQKERLLGRLLVYAAVLQDTSDSDNQLALFGFFQEIVKDVSQVNSVQGIWAVSPRHVDLSFPGAFNKAIVGNRPDFRAFDPVKNYHEGTGLVARADQEMSDPELAKQALEACLQNQASLFVWPVLLGGGLQCGAQVRIAGAPEDSQLVLHNEIRRTYTCIMMASGLDPFSRSSWEFCLRAFPCCVLPFPEEHLLSHHYFAREFLFDRGDLEGNQFGDPLTSKSYNRIVGEIDGEVAADSKGAYDRKADVVRGHAAARRRRARKIVQDALEQWDAILGVDHLDWLNTCELNSSGCLSSVTDVIVMAPITMTDELWSKLRTAKRLWGMFFALDNAAEYGHWVAKNIFRNNFNTALDEQGTLRMLKQIHTKELTELRAHFHPTELFKGELGQVSWADARDLVKPVFDLMANGGSVASVTPMLGLYNCYNCAKSPKGDPQQISDPLTVFEYLNFSQRFAKQDAACPHV